MLVTEETNWPGSFLKHNESELGHADNRWIVTIQLQQVQQ